MKILGLDTATQTGWAVAVDGNIIKSGTKSFAIKKKIEGAGMKFLKFEGFLDTLNKEHGGFDAVFFEQVVCRQPSVKADHSYGGFQATLTKWCERNKIPYKGVAVNTNKKSATGNGNASKAMMIEAAKLMWFDPKDDNEADAIHVLNYALKNEL